MNGDQSSTNNVEKLMKKAMDEDKGSGRVGLLRFLSLTTHGARVEAPSRVVHFYLQKSISNTQPIRVTRECRLGMLHLTSDFSDRDAHQ
jgi:hypothetical protein